MRPPLEYGSGILLPRAAALGVRVSPVRPTPISGSTTQGGDPLDAGLVYDPPCDSDLVSGSSNRIDDDNADVVVPVAVTELDTSSFLRSLTLASVSACVSRPERAS